MKLYSVLKEPSVGLLSSIAMRYNHSFGMPKHEIFAGSGIHQGFNKEERLSLLVRLRKIYDVVVKNGEDYDDLYAKITLRVSKELMLKIHQVDEKILKEDIVRMIEEMTGHGFYQEKKEDHYKSVALSEE